MNTIFLFALAFVGGVFLAVQGGLNAQLGVLLKNPLLASLVVFFTSACYALLVVAVSVKDVPTLPQLRQIPYHLWFTGGLCSVLGIGLYYYTIPKLGISTMISLGLCGQLIFSVIAGHFGWFNLPVQPVDYQKTIGVIAMIVGIILINR
ncbi:DMT family transporter [Tunicatimonas pelagia]|uniref:DMT family transporter n=1 Tax=Tunicatimonas pelagia TaxID=931531 RepID=UPI0026664C17|nr:DMT family transporter [Tunicatimonas pelagia]WKN40845.1 DMT family transporter [Tunicatimonas pelagia]